MEKKIKIIKYLFLIGGLLIFLGIILLLMYKNTNFFSKKIKKHKTSKLPQEYSLSINNSVFEGMDKSLIPYKLVAKKVNKDKSNQYLLQSLYGKYFLKDGELVIKSQQGQLDEINKKLHLIDDVVIEFNGFILMSKDLYFDINTKDIESNSPVIFEFKNSAIKANKLETNQNTKIIKFENGVESILNLKDF